MPRQPNPSVSVRYSNANPCQGVNKDIDRSILKRTELVSGVNLRVKAGSVVCRGGQVKRNDAAMDGAVYGFIDTEGEFDNFPTQANYPGLYLIQVPIYPYSASPPPNVRIAGRFYGAGLSHSNHWRADGVGYSPDGPITRQAPSGVFGIEYRTIQPFRGKLIVVAWQDDGGVPHPYLWEAVLGVASDIRFNTRLVEIDYATIGEVIDFCVREESGEEILYCSTTKGRILRWDGESLTVAHTMALESPTRVICLGGEKLFAAGGNDGWPSTPAPCAYQLTVGGAWVDLANHFTGIGHYNGLGPIYINALSEFLGVCVISGSSGEEPSTSGGDWLWNPSSPSVLSVAWGNAQASLTPPAVDWRTGSTANDGRVQHRQGVVAGGKYFATVRHPRLGGEDQCSLLVANSLDPSDFSFVAVPMEFFSFYGPALVVLNDKVVYVGTGFLAQDGAGGLETNFGLIMVDPSNLNPIWYFPIDYHEFWGFDLGLRSIESYLIPDSTLPDPASDPDIPVASFSFSPTSGARPLTVNFTDTSTSGSDPITSWEWIFYSSADGIGGQSNSQNPSFVFNASAGVAVVNLKVTNSRGTSFCRKFINVT